MKYRFAWAWLEGAWHPEVTLSVQDGIICAIQVGAALDANLSGHENVQQIPGAVLPGMPNLHSHAFQWALAGRSEYRTQDRDSFWTWRDQMFRLLETLDADLMYRIARDVYGRMVQAGYTSVGEFHYVHLDPELRLPSPSTLYADVLIQAALDVGLAICMLPTLYQRGGFDGSLLQGGQRRFHLEQDSLLAICDELQRRWKQTSRVQIGIAIHSLRAVAGEVIQQTVDAFRRWSPSGPIHVHAGEQVAEVDQCLAATGQRPVEWLLNHLEVDDKWCIIHATHTNQNELSRLAQTSAVVGLCPMTEANLGDGLFDIKTYLGEGGRWGIGSDSQISVRPAEELRMLELGQRLSQQQRVVLADADRSCGEFLYLSAARGGAQALGFPAGEIKVGHWADLVVIDLSNTSSGWSPFELNQPAEFNSVRRQLDQFVFTDSVLSTRVMTAGTWRY